MSNRSSRRGIVRGLYVCLILVMIALLAAGCGVTVQKSETAGPDWSRGVLVGISAINNRPAIAWSPETQDAILAWVGRGDDALDLQFARIDDQGEVVLQRSLDLGVHNPTQLSLVRDSAGKFYLFWLDSSVDGPAIYRAQVTSQGDISSEPQSIPSQGGSVGGYAVVEAAPGSLDLFWSAAWESVEGLYHARVAGSGEVAVTPHALGVEGQQPDANVALDGVVHLAWHASRRLGSERIVYATFDPQTGTLGESAILAEFPTGTGTTLHPPRVGLDSEFVYVFWSTDVRAGLSAGTAQTFYRAFPVGHPEQVSGSTLNIPTPARPRYVSATGAFNYAAIAQRSEDPAAARQDSNYTYMPYPIPGQRSELAVLVSSYMALPKRSGLVQVAFAVMQGGKMKGYEVAARTRSASMRPIAVADEQNAVHLAWLDAGGFATFEVFYASTAPSVREAINRLTFGDVVASLASRSWSAATGLAFFPMLIVWLFLPFAWLVVFYLFRPDSDLRTQAGRVGLVVALVLYMFSKMFMFPQFLWYVPFLDVVPPQFEGVLIVGFPILIAALALLGIRLYTRRSERKVVLVAFAIFAAVDSVLSLTLYMPNAVGI